MEAKVTLPYLIAEKANPHPERIFAYFENETITYGQLHEKTNRLANALVNIGIQKSSHVGIFAQNSPEFLLSWFSLAKIGAVMVPINTRLMGELLAYIINDSDIETMIIEEQFIEKLLHVKKQLKHLKTLQPVDKVPYGAGLQAFFVEMTPQERLLRCRQMFTQLVPQDHLL